jgi:hypothetical protein
VGRGGVECDPVSLLQLALARKEKGSFRSSWLWLCETRRSVHLEKGLCSSHHPSRGRHPGHSLAFKRQNDKPTGRS